VTSTPKVPADLDHEVVERRGPQDRLLLLLHGYGQSPHELTSRLDLLDPDGRYRAVVPTGPLRKKGRPIWFRALSGDSEEANQQFLASFAQLDDFLDARCAELGLDRSQAVVGGFSQGAGLAMGLLLAASGRARPAACLSFCGFAPFVPGFRADPDAAAGRPVLFVGAERDRYVTAQDNRETADALAHLGLHVTYAPLDIEHVLTDEAARAAAPWLAEVADGASPATIEPGLAGNAVSDLLRAVWSASATG
jgi:predicted esterase